MVSDCFHISLYEADTFKHGGKLMALRNLTTWDDPVFRKKSRDVEKFDERLWNLLDDMRDTLDKVNGYGCAAVHVGILRRAVVINDKSGTIELINPQFAEASSDTQNKNEQDERYSAGGVF